MRDNHVLGLLKLRIQLSAYLLQCVFMFEWSLSHTHTHTHTHRERERERERDE